MHFDCQKTIEFASDVSPIVVREVDDHQMVINHTGDNHVEGNISVVVISFRENVELSSCQKTIKIEGDVNL